MNVIPQVTAYASKGGSSRVLAQLLLLMAIPSVHRPSLMLGLNGTFCLTAPLNSWISLRHVSAATPSRRGSSSSNESAFAFVISRMWYSSFHDLTAIFRIGVVAEIGSLVDEASSMRIDHNCERIGVLLKLITDS